MQLPYKGIVLLCFCFFVTFCHAASVTVFNDSPFRLTATVLAADGTYLGALTINPRQQMTWQNSDQTTQSFSQTPFTVLLACVDGTEYGVVGQVATGAFISAQSSEGRRVCKVYRKDEKQPEPPPPLNPNQWQENVYYGG